MRSMISGVLILILWGAVPALAQLPPEIQADLYLLRAEQAIGESDPARALVELDKIILLQKEHELDLPDEFHFRYAKVAAAADLPKQALEAVVRYLTAVGREGQHYEESLQLLNQVDGAIEASKESQEASTDPTEARPTPEPEISPKGAREAVDRIPPPDIKPELVGSLSRPRLDCKKWKKRSYWKKATGVDVFACLDAGASPNAPRKVKKTPLSMAAEYNENPDVFKVLIAAGANLEARSWYKRTPLHIATIFSENPEVIKVLIAAGANLEALDDEEMTPLHWAAGWGTPEIIKMLVAAGASLEARDKYGKTPLHWATGMGMTGPPPLENTKALLAAGANPNAQNRWGRRPKEEVLAAARGTRTKKSGGGGLGALIAGVAVGTALGAAGASEEEALAAGTVFAEQVRTGQQSTGGFGPASTAGGATGGGSCEIPGYPSPPAGVANLGLPWCSSSVDFQVRAFALQAAGAQCAIATGSSSTPEQIQARRREITAACGRLAALSARDGISCRCPAGYGR